jgi:hypothetical protein
MRPDPSTPSADGSPVGRSLRAATLRGDAPGITRGAATPQAGVLGRECR